ncbi:phosphatidylinositol-3,4,5-trisphosphate binding [Desmophyllum pertusum]|uniref:Phosphatidylinositol-3,4,5-trisphosphate binding n=1 Tax=Desmophyllum pertusum TaxID=174260 RepID=A0A9W9YYP6_9CNID|nr:phosphatidylinositol-3,4,5-trisphosphate binding [Desmophyllum pertusum]
MVEGHKNRFVIVTYNKSYSFQGDSEFDVTQWTVAIETAIQTGLGDKRILEKVRENPSNRYCADCGMKDPVWASVNFVFVFAQNVLVSIGILECIVPERVLF